MEAYCGGLRHSLLYNLSFEKGIVPEKLKFAKIVPIFTGGDSALPSNYIHISLLIVFNKLLEKKLQKIE